jgi:Tfp pilus assembly protein PilE
MTRPHRGFTLLIAIILASVSLVIGLALADVAYKQVVLSSAARNSQVAFYRADSAMECALYYDQQFGAFNVGNAFDQNTIRCEGRPLIGYTESALPDGGVRTDFRVSGASCASGARSATVTVYKQTTGACSTSGAKNCLYASGFNSCSTTDPNLFERGLKAVY